MEGPMTQAPVVGVTGAGGFLGWHIHARLTLVEGLTVVVAHRDTFGSEEALDRFVSSADVIVHAAGVNRPRDASDYSANVSMAEALVDAMHRTGRRVPVLYLNSVQTEADSQSTNPYAASKAEAADRLRGHQDDVDADFLDLVLPHVFGEFGQPNYNSAVATFAWSVAAGREPQINGHGQLELVHAQDVAGRIVDFVRSGGETVDFAESDGEGVRARERMKGREISVVDAWQMISRLHSRYVEDFTVPLCADRFELQMFNMIRSHLYLADFYPQSLVNHADDRGSFAEACRSDGLGQTSVSTTVPGISRGDHFHLEKIERFIVIGGSATIQTRRVLTNEVKTFAVTGDEPVWIDMPPLTTHRIINTGSEIATTLFWAADHFDAANPDTFPDPVHEPETGVDQ